MFSAIVRLLLLVRDQRGYTAERSVHLLWCTLFSTICATKSIMHIILYYSLGSCVDKRGKDMDFILLDMICSAIYMIVFKLQERKKIIKGMKGHVSKIARDDHGYMVSLFICET